jgi:hypothetical protein
LNVKTLVRFSIISLIAICVIATISSIAHAAPDNLYIYRSGRFIIYRFEFYGYNVRAMQDWLVASNNAHDMVWRIINDNFRGLQYIEKVLVVAAAKLIIATRMWWEACNHYIFGKSMYVYLQVDPAVASVCVSISQVRALWGTINMAYSLWYASNCIPWISLPIP